MEISNNCSHITGRKGSTTTLKLQIGFINQQSMQDFWKNGKKKTNIVPGIRKKNRITISKDDNEIIDELNRKEKKLLKNRLT